MTLQSSEREKFIQELDSQSLLELRDLNRKVSEEEKIASLIYMYKLGASTRYERYVLKLAILQLNSGWKSKDVENWVCDTLKKFGTFHKIK